jgi:hypothetical protein
MVKRSALSGLALVLLLTVCGAALAENYTFKRTKAGDALAASLTLRKTDLPAQLGLIGGRIKPDETPNTDSCNGYTPKQHDLVVVGDAETNFHDSAHSLLVDTQVQVFQSSAMTAADVQRAIRNLTPACQTEEAKQEHVKLVSYAVLGRPKCTCDFAISLMFETKTARATLNNLTIITAIRKGRYEAGVITRAGTAPTDVQKRQLASQTALIVQGLAVKATLAHLHAT